jgi:hypothetical protein
MPQHSWNTSKDGGGPQLYQKHNNPISGYPGHQFTVCTCNTFLNDHYSGLEFRISLVISGPA